MATMTEVGLSGAWTSLARGAATSLRAVNNSNSTVVVLVADAVPAATNPGGVILLPGVSETLAGLAGANEVYARTLGDQPGSVTKII